MKNWYFNIVAVIFFIISLIQSWGIYKLRENNYLLRKDNEVLTEQLYNTDGSLIRCINTLDNVWILVDNLQTENCEE
jgi:Na+/alanine symporter